jgi:hypothetical protein
MAERKKKVLLTANLKIALITHDMVLVTLSGRIGDIHS